jgi:exonuclease SbcD
MKVLHTADWHVGKTLRGRSRTDEHEAVLAEIAAVAASEEVDLALVVGDIFDTAAPTAEAERVAYGGLLALAATGAEVVVVSGNHDNERRLQAVAPLLGLGHIVTRAQFASAADGGVVTGVSRGGDPWRLAVIPFLSQRWVVRAADLMALDADAHGGAYAARVARIIEALTAGFRVDEVNLVAAHLHVAGGMLGGGERTAHTIFDYAVSPGAFPVAAHYVALGHLHRAQAIAGPCPIRYSGSPLQLDFGETADVKSVTVVEASPGAPARHRQVQLSAGRRLRTVRGTLAELAGLVDSAGEDWLRVVVTESPRIGLSDDVRALFINAIDVVVDNPAAGQAAGHVDHAARRGRSPHDLFAAYLGEMGQVDTRVLALFDRLMDGVAP